MGAWMEMEMWTGWRWGFSCGFEREGETERGREGERERGVYGRVRGRGGSIVSELLNNNISARQALHIEQEGERCKQRVGAWYYSTPLYSTLLQGGNQD